MGVKHLRYYFLRGLELKTLILIFFLLTCKPAYSQLRIQGFVYDGSGISHLQGVSVICSSGNGTLTDTIGRYSLIVFDKDSIWFSYLGKETKKFSTNEIPDLNNFNISIVANIQVLKEVKVRTPDYKFDSTHNRIEYAKVFNYKKPTFGSVVEAISITGIVIDLDELIRVFQYRKKKMMIGFQKRLLDEEQEKYISHRFNKLLVSEITGLQGEVLDSFMVKYRPSYEFTTDASDYTFRKYLKDMKDIYVSEILLFEKPSEKENDN